MFNFSVRLTTMSSKPMSPFTVRTLSLGQQRIPKQEPCCQSAGTRVLCAHISQTRNTYSRTVYTVQDPRGHRPPPSNGFIYVYVYVAYLPPPPPPPSHV
jgi:hypothetical protein